MAKIAPISGFPEWLPQHKIIEDHVIQTIKNIYISHGYTSIETRSVEHLSTLASKGEISKEIYALSRAQGEVEAVSDTTLALHFDLTIPFARYVAQNFSELDFPFKRYQLQRSWRGERPQEGRFREFYQFDIDVVSLEDLPQCHDAEMVTIIFKTFTALNLGDFRIKVNNRKLLLGIYEHFGLTPEQRNEAVITVDKINKIGAEAVVNELEAKGISRENALGIVKVSELQLIPSKFNQIINGLGPKNTLFNEGVAEINSLLQLLSDDTQKNVIIDISLARGLDYYTGTIIETILIDHLSFGSVAGGGRYENLTSRFSNKKIPGVGISIGVTRLMSLIVSKGIIKAKERSPTKVLIALNSGPEFISCLSVAEALRSQGIPTEVFHKPLKLGKQIEYADKKGIRYVLFLQDGGKLELKDLISKEQKPVSISDIADIIATLL